jgi:signal transduction histidine kinase
MPFRVQARTILQLGAELISSDAIAFYELIKNSFDAGAKSVRINITSYLPHEVCNELLDDLDQFTSVPTRGIDLTTIKQRAQKSFSVEGKHARDLLQEIVSTLDTDRLRALLIESSQVRIDDAGSGMSLDDLRDVYLTIGTRMRYEQRRSDDNGSSKVVLGEKGLGRLSAMRLGRALHVRTTKAGEKRWSELAIDWNIFTHETDQFLEDVPVEPHQGALKEDSASSGTSITISHLTSDWSLKRVENLVSEQFSRFIDPFDDVTTFKIFVRFNGKAIERYSFDRMLLEAAHATLDATFSVGGTEGPIVRGRINYQRYGKVKSFEDRGTHLLQATGVENAEQLQRAGPFKLRLYWFNRKDIDETAGLNAGYVKGLVRNWAGGVMVYRDGFRVNPYGGPADDWLGLDRKALASGGYKMNRNQLIGKLDISGRQNPELVDQTNREGLRDSEAKAALMGLLRHVILNQFKKFLNQVEEELAPSEPLTISEIEERVSKTSGHLRKVWSALLKKYPEVKETPEIVEQVEEALDNLSDLLEEARNLVESYSKGRNQLVHLAGIGLMVEVVGHELNRATEYSLRSLADAKRSGNALEFESSIDSLQSQLKTLQKRLRVLDPLSAAGRQVKETFDLIPWIEQIFESRAEQFKRHTIEANFVVEPSSRRKLTVHAVKGMVVQIVENLLTNSVYWLAAEKRVNPAFRPKLRIEIDVAKKQLRVWDNGPGVPPDRAEEIFEAFVTSKPPGEGKGLGLYIGRELAQYHGCSLSMSDRKSASGQLNTFVFDFGNIVR